MEIPGLNLLETEWMDQALCRKQDPELYFGLAVKQEGIKIHCRPCPVLRECLEYALDNNIKSGVWGGLTSYERNKLIKGRPTNWTRVLFRERVGVYKK